MQRTMQATDRELLETATAQTAAAFGASLSIGLALEDTGKIKLTPSIDWEKKLSAALCAVSALNERIKGAPLPKIGD